MYSVYGQYKTAISQLWVGYSFVYLVYGKKTANTQLWVGYSFIYSVYVQEVQVAGFALRAVFAANSSATCVTIGSVPLDFFTLAIYSRCTLDVTF